MPRFAQCDATCTADCGACKGYGPPGKRGGIVARSSTSAGTCWWVSLSKGIAMPCRDRVIPGSLLCAEHLIEYERTKP